MSTITQLYSVWYHKINKVSPLVTASLFDFSRVTIKNEIVLQQGYLSLISLLQCNIMQGT